MDFFMGDFNESSISLSSNVTRDALAHETMERVCSTTCTGLEADAFNCLRAARPELLREEQPSIIAQLATGAVRPLLEHGPPVPRLLHQMSARLTFWLGDSL